MPSPIIHNHKLSLQSWKCVVYLIVLHGDFAEHLESAINGRTDRRAYEPIDANNLISTLATTRTHDDRQDDLLSDMTNLEKVNIYVGELYLTIVLAYSSLIT